MFRPFKFKVRINVFGDKLSLTRFVYNVHFSIGLQQAQKTAWWLEIPLEDSTSQFGCALMTLL